jgi:hypothetical protein
VANPTFDFGSLDSSNLPGNPVFENPFSDEDPRSSIIALCFVAMEEFRKLAGEYPTLSIEWKAYFPTWSVWPPSHSFAGESKRIPSAPGAELHIEGSAGQAAERLLGFSVDRSTGANHWVNPARDRWLNTEGCEPWEFWLHALREFWLNARELAEASGADMEAFDKKAEECGYLPAHSSAVGGRVWALMVTQQKSLQRVLAEQGLSNLDEIGPNEEVAGWIQDGKITHAFTAFGYFCGVIAARRIRELKNSTSPTSQPHQQPRLTSDDLAVEKTGVKKGDAKLLQKADGSFYKAVDFLTAEAYAGVGSRRRQQLKKDGVLDVTGSGQNRRITVESLMKYCPPVEDPKSTETKRNETK